MNDKINLVGISTFFYFAIPAVLALAAIWWLAFGEGVHYFRRVISQEKRHAEIVGAAVLPREPLKLVADDPRDAPVVVDRLEVDGADLWIYYKNVGQWRVRNITYSWKQIAPDGTVVKADEGYIDVTSRDSPAQLDPGERGEAHLKIPPDPRAVTLKFKMSR